MTISTINRYIQLFSEAFAGLRREVPGEEVEQLAMRVHQSMEHGRRVYHRSAHVFSLCEGMNPRQILAALYHDVVYYQLDGGFPGHAQGWLRGAVQVEGDVLRLKPFDAGNRSVALCAAVFGFRPGDVLPLFGGMNEFLSAVVAVRSLQPYLSQEELLAIACCIEATVPFRNDGPDALTARLAALSPQLDTPLDASDITRLVVDAVQLANADVGGFSDPEPAAFLSSTWLLIEESNAPLTAVGLYSIQDYRKALQRMEGFLGGLNPDNVFHRHAGFPNEAVFAGLQQAAHLNIHFATEYLGAKLAVIGIVEALALLTGGDCPVSMILGDIRSDDGRPDRVEDFLPPSPHHRPVSDALLEVLERGRSRESRADLTASPLTAYVCRWLGQSGLRQLLGDARAMFADSLSPQDFLARIDGGLVRAIANAAANIALSRQAGLRALAAAA